MEELTPRATKDPLWFGTIWHIAMAHWYCGPGLKRGADPDKIIKALMADSAMKVRTNGFTDDEKFEEAEDLMLAMLDNYLAVYGDDADWHVLAPEQAFQMDILPPAGSKRRRPIAVYLGTFDLGYKEISTGKILLGEHKTAAGLGTRHLAIDDQGGTYFTLATDWYRHTGDLGPRERVAGVTYNIARKAKKDDRPRNEQGHATNKPVKEDYLNALGIIKPYPKGLTLPILEAMAEEQGKVVLGAVSKAQPAPLLHRERLIRTRAEVRTQIQRIRDEAQTINAYRRGVMPLFKNPTKDCSWDCDFFELCLLHEKSNEAEVEEFKQLVFTHRDPYAYHRNYLADE